MTDFLLELLSEEIPARMQEKACADLARLFEAEIGKAGLRARAIETYATPRRLALIARDLPEATAPVREETKGPRASAPPQALEGFLRKTGLAREALVERDGVLFAIIERPGRATADVLAAAVPAIIRAFPWPKSMRWGEGSASTASLRWVRPLQGVVAVLGEEIVPFAIDGIASGAVTYGHRFHHPGPITIGSAEDYAAKLRACHVILDPAERRAIIEDGARGLAEARGLSVVPDAGLVAENAGLTEWPVPLLGEFDAAFLEVPPEVIRLTMRTNQKYFACVDEEGRLAPVFICTANIAASDGGAGVVAGNRKVLAARLADARFFWEQDLKVPLAEQAKKLDRIVFHEKLGTVADKAERVAKLARWLVEEGIVGGRGSGRSSATDPRHPRESGDPVSPGSEEGWVPASAGMTNELADLAEQAALLCKADLVTGMVGEFPELQGVMGGYYARAEGLPDEVADAIRDHYKPVGQGDEVPTAPVTVAVSLADKLDSLHRFFAAEMVPTGSKDPFALRRAALGVINIVIVNGLKLPIGKTAAAAFEVSPYPWGDFVHGRSPSQQWRAVTNLRGFFVERFFVWLRERNVPIDYLSATLPEGEAEFDLRDALARVKALQALVGTEDGANLLAGYKRAANILKKEGWGEPAPLPAREGLGVGTEPAGSAPGSAEARDPSGRAPTPDPSLAGRGEAEVLRSGKLSYAPEPAEAALITALDQAQPEAERAVAAEEFEGAMAALARLRAPIDAFFENVTVNDPDPAKREARLDLLARVRAAVHQVADFSRIEG